MTYWRPWPGLWSTGGRVYLSPVMPPTSSRESPRDTLPVFAGWRVLTVCARSRCLRVGLALHLTPAPSHVHQLSVLCLLAWARDVLFAFLLPDCPSSLPQRPSTLVKVERNSRLSDLWFDLWVNEPKQESGWCEATRLM